MENRPGGGDFYATPSNQQIILKGQTCIEPISLPGLQNYYANLQMVGREYGYFQLSHFDFPLNDSLTKTFLSDYIDVGFRVMCFFSDNMSNLHNPSQWWSTQYDTVFTIPVRRVHSIADIADRLNNAMTQFDLNADNNAHRWKFFLHSVSWDSVLQKIVLTLKIPNNVYIWNFNGSRSYPMKIVFYFYGTQQSQAAKLAAALFGGKTADQGVAVDGATWVSEFDTGETEWLNLATEYAGFDSTNKDLHEASQNYVISSQRPPRMFVDPYVYIRGAPSQSIWEGSGDANNLVSVQPRNRPAGVITNEQAYLANQSHVTKTALSSLRSMLLRFTDGDGNLLQLDEDYVVKLSIEFQQ